MGLGNILSSAFKFMTSGWFKASVIVAINTVKILTGKEKPTVTEALPLIAGNMFAEIQKAIQYENLDTREKVDQWLAELDCQTGEDEGAVDLIPDLSPDQEEAFFDHQKEAIRIWAYAKIDNAQAA